MRKNAARSLNRDKRRGRELVRLRIEWLEDRALPTAGPTLAVDNTPLAPPLAPLISAGPATGSALSSVQQSPATEKSSLATPAVASIRVTNSGGVTLTSASGGKFGQVTVGQSAIQSFTISNSGTAALVLSGSPLIQISGPQAGDYLVTQPSSATVPPGGSVKFSVTFSPQSAGSRTAAVSIASNAANAGSYQFALTGTGLAPAIGVSGNSQFGTVVSGQSLVRTFTISNPGSAMLQLTGKPSIQIAGDSAGDFQVTTQPYSALIAPGWSVSFSVCFSPKVLGNRTATVVIDANVPGTAVYQLALAATAVAPAIVVSGNTQFGSVATGQAVTQVFTISNPGTAPLVLNGKPIVQVTGAQAGDFQVTPPAVTTVPAGGSTTFRVSFSPKAAGVRTATITINSNALGTPSDVFTLTGTGLAVASIRVTNSGAVTLTSASGGKFGQVTVGQSAIQSFTISNSGTAALVLSGSPLIQISGPQAGDYLVTQPSSATVPPGGSVKFSVTFSPQSAGSRTAAVSIASNAANAGSYQFALTGTGLAPAIGVSGNSQFGTVVSGQSLVRTFTISNPGSAMLQLTGKPSIQIAGDSAGDFQVTTQPYSALIAPGWSVSFSVCFSPKVLGNRTATVVIDANVPGTAVYQLALAATAVAPAIAVSGNTQFGSVAAGQAVSQVFTISNPGTAPLVLTGKPIVQVTGAQAGDFQVTPPAVTTVPAGGSTTFSVRFSPKAAGARTATITINSNALGTPSDVFTLTGTGLAAAITVSGNTQFAQTMLSQNAAQTFTISNPGTAPLVLTGSAPVKITGPQAGDFAVTQPSVTTIQPGGSATFSINFCPQGVGSRTATVTVTSNALGMASDALAIAGTGLDIPPVVNAAPAAGLRVKITPPEYAGTNVYYTLYLPTDWVPGKLYPVIVEYAPNDYAPAGVNGTVDDTELGYYASGGKGFIWVTMPFINYTTTPASNATMWWGNGNVTDPEGIQLTAQFCETNLIRILQNYGGNPAEVFLTGFSRGGMATGVIGLLNSQMADIWAGFIPDSGADWSTTDLALTDGRPTFFVCCQNDPNAQESYSAYQYLTSLDDPCTWNVVPNATHTATWIEDDAPAADLAIRQLLQEWLANVIATHPGTYSIFGTVTDANGKPLAGVKIQSGPTHWTYTDANGNYQLAGLIDSSRTLTASLNNSTQSVPVAIAGSDVQGENFTL